MAVNSFINYSCLLYFVHIVPAVQKIGYKFKKVFDKQNFVNEIIIFQKVIIINGLLRM